jgi:hypothetical protein
MHTPGPWKVISEQTAREVEVFEIAEVAYLRVIPDCRGDTFALAGGADDDARLIAAAPQLLLALQRLTRPDDGRGPADEDLAYALDVIRAATGSQ